MDESFSALDHLFEKQEDELLELQDKMEKRLYLLHMI